MKSYVLMHLDRRVATVRADGTCTVYAPSFLPCNLFLVRGTDLDARLNNQANFQYWCASRLLTLDRVYAKEILNAIGKKQATTDRDRAEIALSYRAVSLTDVYWVRALRENVRFADVNLYDRSLSDAFVEVSLRGKNLTRENAELLTAADTASDVGTQGVSPKAWVKRGDAFYLLKDGDKKEVAAELLASKIASCFAVRQVTYTADVYGGEPVSKCRLFTSKEQSLVPMEQVEIYAANHDTDRMKLVNRVDPYGFHMMNLVDYLVGNTDRHWGNWGFLADTATNRFVSLSPLMDFNKAFSSYDTLDGATCLTLPGRLSQREAALLAVKTVGLNQRSPVKKEWFPDEATYEMFRSRLDAVKQ